VDKLPGMQTAKLSLATHTTVAELVKEKIDSEEFLAILKLYSPSSVESNI